MKSVFAAAMLFVAAGAVADEKPASEDSVHVRVVGALRTRVVAVGGETTGVTITAKRITWELEFGSDNDLRKAAEALNGKQAVVEGTLERRPGVEVKERWIVKVTKLEAAGE